MVAYNEADVLDATLRGLVEQGCDVYVIDHGSTDATGEIARSWVGRGVVGVERFPEDSGFPARNAETMVWADLLRRREQLVQEIDADWYILSDADEFREAPWPGLTLAEGLARAEVLGYNAVNFRVLNFRPTGPGFEPGDDPRERLTLYEPADVCDVAQIKAFKRPQGALDILTYCGHDVRFDGRRVCPIPFILRHYPIRSPEHGRRKVLTERLPRFAAEERRAGWHVQYDELVADGTSFTWDAAELEIWDPHRVRAEVLAHAVEAVLVSAHSRGEDLTDVVLAPNVLRPWVQRRLGFALDDDDFGRARDLFDRMLRGEDPAAFAAAGAELAPIVLALFDALAAQLDVAGRVMDVTPAAALRERFGATLPQPPRVDHFPGARSFVTYLHAEEAVAAPELVAAFGRAFDAESDATLVIAGVGWSDERLAEELGAVVTAVGLDGPSAPDLLAVSAVPGDLGSAVHAVLTLRPPLASLEALPHVDADGAEVLRELAARRAA
jgi:hypothetical protein